MHSNERSPQALSFSWETEKARPLPGALDTKKVIRFQFCAVQALTCKNSGSANARLCISSNSPSTNRNKSQPSDFVAKPPRNRVGNPPNMRIAWTDGPRFVSLVVDFANTGTRSRGLRRLAALLILAIATAVAAIRALRCTTIHPFRHAPRLTKQTTRRRRAPAQTSCREWPRPLPAAVRGR